MPFFRVILQYTQPNKGWSEVYYREATDIASASNYTNSFLDAAQNFRAGITQLAKIRVQDLAQPRVAQVVNVLRRPTPGTNSPDVANTSAIWTLSSPAIGAKRQVWFRGLFDVDVTRDPNTGVDQPSSALLQNVRMFIIAMRNAAFRVQQLIPLTGSPWVYNRITSVIVNGDGTVRLTTASPFLTTGSGQVILSRFDNRVWTGLNGRWRVLASDSAGFTVGYHAVQVPATYTTSTGRTRPGDFRYGEIVLDSPTGFNKLGSRDTGKNPLGGRGRRPRLIHGSR